MPNLNFQTLDVFTTKRFSGNPLAVFANADGIPVEKMALIGKEFNLSETVFIQSPDTDQAIAKLRIMTPTTELPFAGHPTIGASLVLSDTITAEHAAAGFVIETRAGLVRARVIKLDGQPAKATIITPQLPKPSPAENADLLAAALGLESDMIMAGHFAPSIWSAGTPFTFVGVRDRATLAKSRVDSAAWDRAFGPDSAPKVFVYSMDDWANGTRVDARMYAPTLGVPEDPATGSASAAMAGLLAKAQARGDGRHSWIISQGVDMGRPSVIEIAASIAQGNVVEVTLSGSAIRVSEGRYLSLE